MLIHPLEVELLDGIAADPVQAGETLSFGALEVRPLHTPGHTAGMLSFLVGDRSGDRGRRRRRWSSAGALPDEHGSRGVHGRRGRRVHRRHPAQGSVGGVRASSGHTSYTDLRDSIMGTLMELAEEHG